MATFGLVCVLALSLVDRGWVDALSCYQCGIEANNEDSCEHPPKNDNFIVDCHVSDFCSKTTPRAWQEGDATVERTTRGCATRVTINGKRHELGCHTDQRTGAIVCYCDTNFCNNASLADFSNALVMFVIGLCIVMTCLVHS